MNNMKMIKKKITEKIKTAEMVTRETIIEEGTN